MQIAKKIEFRGKNSHRREELGLDMPFSELNNAETKEIALSHTTDFK